MYEFKCIQPSKLQRMPALSVTNKLFGIVSHQFEALKKVQDYATN
jgi:hypothetical protein